MDSLTPRDTSMAPHGAGHLNQASITPSLDGRLAHPNGGSQLFRRKRLRSRTLNTITRGLAVMTLGLLAVSLSACDSDSSADEGPDMDIVEVAIDGGFNTLVAAVQAADLVQTLQSPGPFTVFAPTDEAFAKLPAGTVESLLLPENKDQLIAILTYHVVAGRVTAQQVVGLESANTVQGAAVQINVENGNVRVNDAIVTTTDIEAANGIIHVIDTVLLPPTTE